VETPADARFIAASKDHTKTIVQAAVDQHNPSELCRATIEILVSIPAGEAEDLSLKVLSAGGIYLA
jgi:glucokinase